jgi:DUF1365 family protein
VTASAIYEGSVRHRRHGPRPHAFARRLFLMYLDLDELPTLFDRRWLWSLERPNLVWFRRADYLGPAARPLKQAVLDRVEADLGRRPDGPVRVLTHLRSFGYLFNPVSFYYAFDAAGALDAVVAEITNTPWGERHAYVLDARGRSELRFRFAKDFHVSPFLDMDHDYEWRLTVPGERLEVHMTNLHGGERLFEAGLACRRRALSPGRMAAVLLRYPFLTARVHLAIYVQALRLWLKRTPFFVHPSRRTAVGDASTS